MIKSEPFHNFLINRIAELKALLGQGRDDEGKDD